MTIDKISIQGILTCEKLVFRSTLLYNPNKLNEMTEKMTFSRAVLLAKRMKQLSLELYCGRQNSVPNTSIFYRSGKAIRMLCDKQSTDGAEMMRIQILAKMSYSADQIVFISDGGLLSREIIDIKDFHRVTEAAWKRQDPNVARAVMIVEATKNYQNVGLLPYHITRTTQGFGMLDWLDINEFQTAFITQSAANLFRDIMNNQRSLLQEIDDSPTLSELRKALATQEIDISQLCDLAGDRKMARLGCIVTALS